MANPRIPRDLRRLVKTAIRCGWRLSVTGSGHLRLTSPRGAVVYFGASPSDWRAPRNVRAQLRREGVPC